MTPRAKTLALLLAVGSPAALPVAVAVAQTHGEHAETAVDKEGARVGEAVDDDHAPTGDGHGGHAGHHAPPPINWLDFGFKSKDVHGGTLEAGEEPMAPPFAMALFNFAVFAGLLVKFAGGPIKRALAGRHDAIKHDLAEAARLRAEAEAKLADFTARTARVNAEVDALIREIRSEAEAEKAQILADAQAQAGALRKDADERIASEIARARHELEREIVAVAVASAEKVLRERTTASDQQALFDRFVASLVPGGGKPTGGAGGGKPTGGTGGAGGTGGGTPGPADDSVSQGWT